MPAATIQLATPHGVWRQVYARRHALHATADATVLAAYQDDVRTVSLTAAVRAWRASIGEAADPALDQRRQTAAAAILAVLAARNWSRTRAALVAAIQRAYHAGWQAGSRLTTTDPGDDSPWDDATDSGYTIGDPQMSDSRARAAAATALSSALAATARAAARTMASSEDPAAAATRIVAAGLAFALALDLAISAAYGLGLLAAYANTGVQSVAWVTAADGAVCERCDAYAQQGPYSPFATPPLPAHSRCRCVLAPN